MLSVSPCSNKFLLEYLTHETDNNTKVPIGKRCGTFKAEIKSIPRTEGIWPEIDKTQIDYQGFQK